MSPTPRNGFREVWRAGSACSTSTLDPAIDQAGPMGSAAVSSAATHSASVGAHWTPSPRLCKSRRTASSTALSWLPSNALIAARRLRFGGCSRHDVAWAAVADPPEEGLLLFVEVLGGHLANAVGPALAAPARAG